jgi:hypothetical protein
MLTYMDHPDYTEGIRRLPADSPALAYLHEAQAPELRFDRGFAPNRVQREMNRRVQSVAQAAGEITAAESTEL